MKKSKINYYLNIAREIAKKSPCTHRRFGAVLVKDDNIIATGYNGSSRGTLNCGSEIECLKDVHNDPNNIEGVKGKNDKSIYDNCPAVHGEVNSIINAARVGISTVGSIMFVAEVNGKSEISCHRCRRLIIQAGIKKVYDGLPNNYRVFDVEEDFVEKENEWIRSKSNV